MSTSALSQQPLRVLLVEDNPGDRGLIADVLARADPPFAVESVERLSGALERLRAPGIDLVLLDLSLPDSTGLATFNGLHASFPLVPVVVMTGLQDDEVALAAVNAGAQDYLEKARVEPRELIRSLRYAVERQRHDRQQAGASRGARIVTVLGPKGGTGKTLVAINLAAALAAFGEPNVALVDLDLSFGDVGQLLGVTEHDGLLRFVQSPESGVRGLLERTAGGFLALKSHSHPELADMVNPGHVEALLAGLRLECSYVIVDTPAAIGANILPVLRTGDAVVLVLDPYRQSIKHAQEALQWLRREQVDPETVYPVLNRVGAEEGLPSDEVERRLGVRLAAALPNQPVAALHTTNDGTPVLTAAPLSGLAAALKHLAGVIGGARAVGPAARAS